MEFEKKKSNLIQYLRNVTCQPYKTIKALRSVKSVIIYYVKKNALVKPYDYKIIYTKSKTLV